MILFNQPFYSESLNQVKPPHPSPLPRRCEKIGLGKGDGSKVEKFRLNLDDNVHDIVYSKNGHDIVNSKLAMYLEIPRPALIATPLMLVLFNLDHIQNGFCH
jgi:hypothetical protein